jgi:hypothetical protein
MKRNEKNNSGKILTVLLLLIVLSALGAGGFFAYQRFLADPGPDYQMQNIHLKEEVITFVFQSMPDVYHGLTEINTEIVLMDAERERLAKIEKEYPKQKKIVIEEKKMWNSLRKEMETAVDNLEKNIETLFVSHSVNPEKGDELMASRSEELRLVINQALEASQQQTARLKITEEKSFIDKIKAKFSK